MLYDGQYQKKVEVITGKILLKILFDDSLSESSHHNVSVNKTLQGFSSLTSMSKVKNVLVTVVRAENLLAKDRGGTSDPFAVLILGRQIKKTNVIYKTLNPEWNETFEFQFNSQESNLNVVVYDYDKGIFFGGTQEYLGSVTVNIDSLLQNGSGEEW